MLSIAANLNVYPCFIPETEVDEVAPWGAQRLFVGLFWSFGSILFST